MAGPPKKTPPLPTLYGYHKKPDFLAAAIDAESKNIFKKVSEKLADLFGSTDAAKKSLEEFAATQVPVDLGSHYMPVGMYLYGGTPKFTYGNFQTMMCSSGGAWDGDFSSSSEYAAPTRATCSTCGALRDRYVVGTLCAACKAKLDQVMDSSRELSPDEVGRALSEFVRKKLAKIEPVDDVRARGIKLEDDDQKEP